MPLFYRRVGTAHFLSMSVRYQGLSKRGYLCIRGYTELYNRSIFVDHSSSGSLLFD